ncbi:5096_t:CDS:2, partial [Acaulospora morrowiae]
MKYTKKTTFVISLLVLSTLHATINAASIVNDVIRRQAGTSVSGNTRAGDTTVVNPPTTISAPNTPVQTRQVLTLIAESDRLIQALPYQWYQLQLYQAHQAQGKYQLQFCKASKTQITFSFVTSQNTSTEPGTTRGTSTEPGTTIGTSTEPGATIGTSTEPGATIGTSTEPGTTIGTSTEPGATIGTSTEPGTTIGTSTRTSTPKDSIPLPSQTTITENVCSDTDCQTDTSTGMTGQIITTTITTAQTDGPKTTITPTITDPNFHPTTTIYAITIYQSTITVIFPGYTTTIYT